MKEAAVETVAPPLARNRRYAILWSGQFLSEFGNEINFVAFPLLILAMSGSALQAGLASSLVAAGHMLANLPAGVVADRWDRRRTLLLCQGGRALAVASVAVAVWLDAFSFPHVLLVALIDGLLGAAFEPAEQAALPQVVPESQLSRAVAANTARPFIATLLGPALAGFLFAVEQAMPFALDGLMLALSFAALMFLRLPARPAPAEPARGAGGDLVAGLRWVLGQRLIRTTLVWMAVSNLVFTALMIIVLAMSHEDKVGAGVIGLTMACMGAGGLLGAALADRLHALLPAPVIIIGFSWMTALLTGLMALVPGGLPLGLLLGCTAFFAPLANTTILTYQITVTPDRLRGRLTGIVGLCSGGAAALGPLLGGALMTAGGTGPGGILSCAAALSVIALATTLTPALRRFPTTG
ncbi:MFS transporter [Streptosporangium sp. NPDC049376]|uniref:MFS transporter n=1 Tax=Streptosporangium sp. NPDC049376 TaxID=3366192 RepID=UPI0037A06410